MTNDFWTPEDEADAEAWYAAMIDETIHTEITPRTRWQRFRDDLTDLFSKLRRKPNARP